MLLETPYWFWALAFLCAIVTLLMLPGTYAGPIRNALIDSDSAKIVALLSAVFGFVVVMSTAYQIMVDLGDRSAEREVRRSEAIERAWQRLLSRAPGNTGKGGAFTLLVREKEGLENVDLSCRAIGDWNNSTGQCEGRPILAGIEIPELPNRQVIFVGMRLDDAIVTQSRIPSLTIFRDVKMRNARISNSELVNVGFVGDIEKLDIETTAIIDTWFSTPVGPGNRIAYSNVSGATIPWLADGDHSDISTNYFWADWPPLRESLHKFEDATEPSPFFSDVLLARMSICRPPIGPDGKVVPHLERKLRFNDYECERMSIQQAKMEFAAAYDRTLAEKAEMERNFP